MFTDAITHGSAERTALEDGIADRSSIVILRRYVRERFDLSALSSELLARLTPDSTQDSFSTDIRPSSPTD